MVNLSTLVRSSTSAMSALPSSTSSNPGLGGKPNTRSTEGRATSASTNITVWSSSAAILIAKLMDVKLLPSPAMALVTMIKLPCCNLAVPLLPMALLMSGRLITRNWSAMRERGALGTTMPAAEIVSRSRSTLRETNTVSASNDDGGSDPEDAGSKAV